MSDDRDAPALEAVRAALGSATPAQTTPAMVERAAFDACGQDDIALDLWQRALATGKEARARIGRSLRAEYGGRSARGGWIGSVLIVLAIASVYPLGSSIGGRFFDPHDLVVPTAISSAVIGVLVLVCVLCAGFKALPAGLLRIFLVLLVSTAVALAVNASTAPPVALVMLIVGFGATVLAVLLWFFGRTRDLTAADALDLAPQKAHDAQQTWLDESLRVLSQEAAERLEPATASDIVRLRTLAGPDLIDRGATFELPAESVPAGEVIIYGVTSDWDGDRGRKS
ncbi:hypothetical protein [Microbacterium sp. NPDC057650]|uniref:hypothetical protein n=1 Tax=unclassified Microbacterium TaxID=2609290 RepID=UPI00366BF47C